MGRGRAYPANGRQFDPRPKNTLKKKRKKVRLKPRPLLHPTLRTLSGRKFRKCCVVYGTPVLNQASLTLGLGPRLRSLNPRKGIVRTEAT